jgi:cell division transport system permease protein
MIARYFRLHLKNLVGALGRIGGSPVGAALNVLVVAIALALPTAMQILLENAGNLAPAFEDAADFTVYLNLDVDEASGRALADAIAARDDVTGTRFISKAEGLNQFEQWSGFGQTLDALDDNPLPHIIKVRPASDEIESIDGLTEALTELDEAATVQFDRVWVERLQAILGLGRRTVDIVSILLAAAVILVVGNTIRLEINNRRVEIEVQKLVGATDGFIRRPFLYTGLWLGALGAVVACLVVGIGLWLLGQPVRQLAALYQSDFELTGLTAATIGLVVGSGAVLGWAGAWIAAARHLKAIEPA